MREAFVVGSVVGFPSCTLDLVTRSVCLLVHRVVAPERPLHPSLWRHTMNRMAVPFVMLLRRQHVRRDARRLVEAVHVV